MPAPRNADTPAHRRPSANQTVDERRVNQLPWYWTEYLPHAFAGLVLLFIGSGRRRTRIRLPLGHDVTLSFAGEDRTLAARIAELCSSTGMTVLYDDFEKAPLWGKDLAVHLDTAGTHRHVGRMLRNLGHPPRRDCTQRAHCGGPVALWGHPPKSCASS